MKEILKEISELAIQGDGSRFNEEQKEQKWLGTVPASEEKIVATETTLGVKLPSDYRHFLLTTNGFFTPSDSTEPTFEKVENIDYLANIDSFLLEVWCEDPLDDVGYQLARSIVVGGINDEQYFLLIPPGPNNLGWLYWKFANWIPGEHRFENLHQYFSSVLDFITGRDTEST